MAGGGPCPGWPGLSRPLQCQLLLPTQQGHRRRLGESGHARDLSREPQGPPLASGRLQAANLGCPVPLPPLPVAPRSQEQHILWARREACRPEMEEHRSACPQGLWPGCRGSPGRPGAWLLPPPHPPLGTTCAQTSLLQPLCLSDSFPSVTIPLSLGWGKHSWIPIPPLGLSPAHYPGHLSPAHSGTCLHLTGLGSTIPSSAKLWGSGACRTAPHASTRAPSVPAA